MKTIYIFLIIICCSFFGYTQVQIGDNINGENTNDSLGWSVATSGDGQTIVVGAPNSSINGDSSGQIKVYQFNGTNWVQLGNSLDSYNQGDNSGRSVDITDDGTTIIIGAQYSDIGGSTSGIIQVFQFNDSDWVQKGNTLNGSSNYSEFGTNVSISNNGNRIAVGAPYSDINEPDAGVLQIFDYDGSQWNLTFAAFGDNENDVFGMSVDMSGDGNHIICGAWINEDNTTREGYAKVFMLDDSIWSQVGSTIFGETPSIFFGASSAISDDGSRIAIGSWGNDENGTNSGEVEVYQLNNNTWEQIGLDLQGDNSFQRFGWSIDLSGNGDVLAIGAYQANYMKIFKLTNNNWSQIGNTLFGANGNDEFGYSIDLTTDGTKIVIGDPSNDNNASYAGFAQVYDITELLSVTESESDLFELFPNPTNYKLNIKSKIDVNKICVIDVNGRRLNTFGFSSENKDLSIDVSNLIKGIYFLEIQSRNLKTIKKFIKK